MQPLEIIAAVAGAISVYLSARENIWSWPTAIVNVSLYTIVFFGSGLYSDMGLQVVYLVLSIYGWHQWLRGGRGHTPLRVSRATTRVWLIAGAAGVAFWFLLSTYTARLPGVSLPRLDSALVTVSLVAQWMMTRKILENWVLWIVADIVYVPMFIYKQLYVTAGLYLVFLALAVLGLIEWRRSLARDRASPVQALPAPA